MKDFNDPKPTKGQQRKSEVINIARRLFEAGGYEAVGVREIAKAAGISPMQVYRLGLDKQDLLAEVILIVNQEIINAIKPFSAAKSKTAADYIESYLLSLYAKDIAIKSIRKEGAAFGWKWSGKYEQLIIAQLMQILKPISDCLTYYRYGDVDARCYAIWSLYYVGYRNAVMNNANAIQCLEGIQPSLAICLKQ